MEKPWSNEFPLDSADGMDDAAIAIVTRAAFPQRYDSAHPKRHPSTCECATCATRKTVSRYPLPRAH